MSKVYGLATCTIAAALGGDGDDGCFTTRNQFKYRPCKVPNPFDHDSSLSFYLRSQYFGEIYRREVKGSPWYSRGWVFQERTLSPRLLVFGETQMLWACQKLHAAETWPCEKTSDNYIDRFESFEVDKSRLQALLNRDRSISAWDTAWFAFIQEFRSAELTRISDRLVALQGLADQIALVTERQYCAGLWIDQTLPLSLLWSISPLKSPRSQEYRAPTWSWGSVDGLIEFKKIEVTTRSFPPPPSITIEVHGIAELPEHQRHLSRVPLANLKLSGKLSPGKLVSESRNGPLKLRRRASTILLKSESAARKRFERVKRALNAIWRSSIVRTVLWAMAVPFLCVGFIPYQFALCIWSCVWNLLKECLPRIFNPIDIWFARKFPRIFKNHDINRWESASIRAAREPVDLSLYADCTSDTLLDMCIIEAFCLPVLKGHDGRFDGLILKLAERGEGYYELVGTFTRSNPHLDKMLGSAPQKTFVLT